MAAETDTPTACPASPALLSYAGIGLAGIAALLGAAAFLKSGGTAEAIAAARGETAAVRQHADALAARLKAAEASATAAAADHDRQLGELRTQGEALKLQVDAMLAKDRDEGDEGAEGGGMQDGAKDDDTDEAEHAEAGGAAQAPADADAAAAPEAAPTPEAAPAP